MDHAPDEARPTEELLQAVTSQETRSHPPSLASTLKDRGVETSEHACPRPKEMSIAPPSTNKLTD